MILFIGPEKDILCTKKLHLFPYPPVKTCVPGAQKHRLIESVL